MNLLQDLRVDKYTVLPTPDKILPPIPDNRVVESRERVKLILNGTIQNCKVVFVGPCSIHSETSAIEYARRLQALQEKTPNLFLVMRFFLQKPRTSVGWTGFLEDPHLNDSREIGAGLTRSVALAHKIVYEIGQPICMELLGTTIEPQYFNNFLTAGFIGARTSESQIHRNLASGVSFPIGIKNPSSGDAITAYHGVVAARKPHSFCGIDPKGNVCGVHTKGNPDAFVVLRGSYKNGPNITSGVLDLSEHNVSIVVDCAHGNSNKDLQVQMDNAIYACKIKRVKGLLIESHLKEGRQAACPKAGCSQSITDPCLGWKKTVELLKKMQDIVSSRSKGRKVLAEPA